MNLKAKKNFLLVICMGLILGTGGCLNLPKRNLESYKFYHLRVLNFPIKLEQKIPQVSWQLTVEEPSSAVRLDTDLVIVDDGYTEVTHIKNIRWIDRLPLLVQQLLLDLFEKSGKIKGVGSPVEGLDSKYILLTDIKSFELTLNPSCVKIRLAVKLMRIKDREVIAAKIFEETFPTLDESLLEVMKTFTQGINQLGQEIVFWTLMQPMYVEK